MASQIAFVWTMLTLSDLSTHNPYYHYYLKFIIITLDKVRVSIRRKRVLSTSHRNWRVTVLVWCVDKKVLRVSVMSPEIWPCQRQDSGTRQYLMFTLTRQYALFTLNLRIFPALSSTVLSLSRYLLRSKLNCTKKSLIFYHDSIHHKIPEFEFSPPY